MRASVVDTNVILVANNAHDDVSPECVIACVERLNELMKSGVLVVDDSFRIFNEYQHKTSPRAAKGVGDLFVQWALRHSAQAHRVHQVAITEVAPDRYAEFPDDQALESDFDPADRKFVAVAHAHRGYPTIWQAADCKWLDWWQPLRACGVEVEFLCGSDVCRAYSKKYRNKPMPSLP